MKIKGQTLVTRLGVLVIATLITSCAKLTHYQSALVTPNDEWQPLLNKELSEWEVWLGVPHSSINGLDKDIKTATNLNQHGDPSDAIGLNNNLKEVFSVIEQDGQLVLKVTGEIYGGLTTLRSFSNYHLSLEMKWGDKKWAPRLNAKRDSGLLFHCNGPHGAFWKVWKACQELQIQETDLGDYIPLAGPSGKIRTNSTQPEFRYDGKGKHLQTVSGYSHASKEPDNAHGEWNKIELLAFEDVAIFIVNSEVVMVVEQSKDKLGQALTSGQLQLQSEGAELYYRDIKIKAINALPKKFAI